MIPNSFSMDSSIKFWLNYFNKQPPIYGGVDLFCLGYSFNIHFAASLIATIDGLKTGNDSSSQELYQKIKVILPFGNTNESINLENLLESIFDKIVDYEPEIKVLDTKKLIQIKEKVLLSFKEKIEFQVCPSNELADLIKIIEASDKLTAILLVDGDFFASTNKIDPIHIIRQTPVNEGFRLWWSEDIWVTNVVAVIDSLNEILKANRQYLVFIVQQETPVKKTNIEKLESFDNINLIFMESSSETAIAEANIENWLQLATNQEIDLLLKDIDKKINNDINKAVIKAQCLAVADHPIQAFQLIQRFLKDLPLNPDPDFFVSMAKIASAAGQREVAINFLREALKKGLTNQLSLENAFKIAKELNATEEKVKLENRLLEFYPLSEDVIHRQFGDAINQNELQTIHNKLDLYVKSQDASEMIKFFYLLTELFANTSIEDFDKIVEEVRNKYPEFVSAATYYCGVYALINREYQTALKFLVSEDIGKNLEEFAVLKLLPVIERILVLKSSGAAIGLEKENEAITDLNLENGFRRILKYFSTHPQDGKMRNSFLQLISPQTSGLDGISYLLKLIVDEDFSSYKIIEKPSDKLTLVKAEDLEEILEFYFSHLEQPNFLGVSSLPEIKSNYTLLQILESLTEFLNEIAYKGLLDNKDLNFYYILLHIVIKLNQQLKTDREFEAISSTASALTGVGNYQKARDLAEQALILSLYSKTENSIRYAWLAFSDIYQRCHNKVESLLGLACALQIDNLTVSHNDLFIQRILLIRVLRDFKFYTHALAEIDKVKSLAEETINPARSKLILGVIESQIEMIILGDLRVEEFRDERVEQLKSLAEKVSLLHKEALRSSNEVFPTALLLSQISRSLIEANEILDDKITDQLLNSLEGTNSHFTNLALALASNNPTFKDIEKLLENFDQNRHLADLATDVFPIMQLARIALTNIDLEQEPEQAVYLLEVLSALSINSPITRNFNVDKNIDALDTTTRQLMGSILYRDKYVLGQDEFSLINDFNQATNLSIQHPDKIRILSTEELVTFSKNLNKQGISIFLLGLDSNENLVVFSSQAQNISAHRELESMFDSERYFTWTQSYPYEYIKIKSDDPYAFNSFVETLEGIGISSPKTNEPVLFISSKILQNFPPNLYLIDNDHPIGIDYPTAIAPSLNWLHKISLEETVWRKRNKAWILKTDESDHALVRLFEETAPILKKNNFSTYREETDLYQLRESDIAIIGAHGSIREFEQYFKAVSNTGDTILTGLGIAEELSNSNLVILFVCSGGRMDQNPYSESLVGLPYEILNHGVRTVIAPPYPIDAGIQSIWLEIFLDKFLTGNTVINSNFEANHMVGEKFNSNPVHTLAMNVFGDPLLKIQN